MTCNHWSLQVPRFAKYGQLFKSSAPVQLTEEETEYNIVVIKHIFPQHTVLQFQCTNTVQEQVLEDVSVAVDLSEAVSFHFLLDRSKQHLTRRLGCYIQDCGQDHAHCVTLQHDAKPSDLCLCCKLCMSWQPVS